MNLRNILPVTSLLFFLMSFVASAAAKTEAIYVWDFTDRSFCTSDVTDKFTNDFELALSKYGSYTIVERRQIDTLLAQKEMESKVSDASKFSSAFRDQLKLHNADLVVFGTVYDDVDSGQYNITITIETFSGEKRIIKSILMPRGKVNDAASRMEAMETLVRDLTQKTASKIEVNSMGLVFQVNSCSLSGNTVIVKLTVTNTEDDNTVRVHAQCGGGRTRIWDNLNSSVQASSVTLANVSDNCQVDRDLISGLPTRCELRFDGLSSKTDYIPRLDVFVRIGGKDEFIVTFRNLALQK